ncbi:MAG: beta-propeller fold lactonase family protein [Aquimonas sp.]|nr:beta-propeller fold lactonase family protein [Aquimonas sp.]
MTTTGFSAGRLGAAALFAAFMLVAAGPLKAQASFSTSTLTGPATYTPGAAADPDYILTVINSGTAAASPVVQVSFPPGVSFTWTCTASGAGSSCAAASGGAPFSPGTGPIGASGGSLVYRFEASYAANLTDPNRTVTATIDPAGANITRSVVSTRAARADLAATLSAQQASFSSPGTINYTATLSNAGPSDVIGANFSFTFAPAAGVNVTGWSCTSENGAVCPTAGGNLPSTLGLNAGGELRFAITATVTGAFSGSTLGATAAIAVPAGTTDPTPANNSATVGLNRSVDLALSYTAGTTGTYTPGLGLNGFDPQSLNLSLQNLGAVQATQVVVNLPLPAEVSSATLRCAVTAQCGSATANGGSTLSLSVGTLPGTQSRALVLELAYASGAQAPSLSLAASAVAAEADGNAANNSQTRVATLDRRARIGLEKSSNVSVIGPGENFEYAIVVRNFGPSDVGNLLDGSGNPAEAGILLDDVFPSGLVRSLAPGVCPPSVDNLPCWRACPSDQGVSGQYSGEICPVQPLAGTGNIQTLPFRLSAGSRSLVQVFARAAPSASGTLVNTAQARLEASTVTAVAPVNTGCAPEAPATACASDSLPVQASVDIGVSIPTPALTAVPGLEHSYQLNVENLSNLGSNNVRVLAALPLLVADGDAGFAPGSGRWFCEAFNGACCNTNSSVCGTAGPTPVVQADNLDRGVDLPPQASVRFTFIGRVDPRALGTLNMSVQAQPTGIADPNTANNSATDSSTVLNALGQLSIIKVLDNLEPVVEGSDEAPFKLSYRIEASNAGPSVVRGAQLRDLLISPLLDAGTASWSCEALPSTGATGCAVASGTGAPDVEVRLDPGGTVRLSLQVDTLDTAVGQVVNTAAIEAGTAGRAETTLVSGLSGEADLGVSLTDGQPSAVPGQRLQYTLEVQNRGRDDVFGARVIDRLPAELEDISWSCSATTPIPGDLAVQGSAAVPGARPDAVLMSLDGRHAYMALGAGNSVQALVRNAVPGQGFGNLTVIETETNGQNDPQDPGATVSGLINPIDLALSPDGRMLFVLAHRVQRDAGGAVVEATRALVSFNRVSTPGDPAFGRLSFAGSTTAGLPAFPRRLVASQGFVYVSGSAQDSGAGAQLTVYRRDAVSGLPAPLLVDPTTAAHLATLPPSPGAMALDLVNQRLLVGSAAGQGLALFAINTAEGTAPVNHLARLGSVLTGSAANQVGDIALRSSERQAYAIAGGSSQLSLLSYAGDTLTVSTPYTYAGLLPDETDPTLSNPLTGRGRLALAADGEHLFLASTDGASLLKLRRSLSNGTLSEGELLRDDPLASAPSRPLNRPVGIAISPDGRHVVLATNAALGNSPGTLEPPLWIYSRRAPDPLFAFLEVDRDPAPTGSGSLSLLSPSDVVVSPDGQHVYAVSLQDGTLTAFRRFPRRGPADEPLGGHLEFLARYVNGIGGIRGLERGSRLQISGDGRQLYVTSEDRNTLAVFNRDATPENTGTFGLLTQPAAGSGADPWLFTDGMAGVDGLLGAQGIAVSDDGLNVYVAGSFESAIALFSRPSASGPLVYRGVVRNGVNGVTGLSGIRDLVVVRGGSQLLGVSSIANAVVVFERNAGVQGAAQLRQLQSLALPGSPRLMALALPNTAGPGEGEHVYVAGQTNSTLYVLRRNTDPSGPNTGRLSLAAQYASTAPGLVALNGVRDLAVSSDGRRVYAASQFSHSVLVFDRELNLSSPAYGGLSLLEVRTDGLEGVDGVDSVYALAVSPDSRNVYAAGFGDRGIASFAIGSGSSCSAGGSGDIDDLINIARAGTLRYLIEATIRPGATGVLTNTATVGLPDRFRDPNMADNTATDLTTLTPSGDLSVSKTNNRVSVVGGETVRYEVVVRNAGPSHLRHAPPDVVTLTDILSPDFFDPGATTWTCSASGSGALDFVQGVGEDPLVPGGLGGVSGLVLVPDPDGIGPIPSYLASASVLDHEVRLWSRSGEDGRLSLVTRLRASVPDGEPNAPPVFPSLFGARSLAASADGRFLYVASRESDTVTVFELSHVGSQLSTTQVEVVSGFTGLDQALHLVLAPGDSHLYVAGANDGAIAVFERNSDTGRLNWVESQRDVDPLPVAGVPSLTGVEFLAVSPDGAHLYAVSGASARVVLFDRIPGTGGLSYRSSLGAADFGVSIDGASSLALSPDGRHAYLLASAGNRLLMLSRASDPVGPAFGQLTAIGSLQQGVGGVQGLSAPRRIVISGDGVHAYVTGQLGGSIAWFSRSPDSGALSFLGLRSDDTGGVDGIGGATGLVLDSDRNQLYVAGTLDRAIGLFERQADSLCPPSGSGDLVAVPIDVAAGGSVTFSIEARVRAGLAPGSTVPNIARVVAPQDPNPDNNEDSDIDPISVVADLAITKTDGLAEIDGLDGVRAVAGDSTRLYTAGASDKALGVFRRESNPAEASYGALRFAAVLRSGVGTVSGLSGVADVLVSSDGAHVYAVSPVENTVVAFRRVPAPQELLFLEAQQNGVLGVSGLAGARALALSPDGRHLYVAGEFANAIAVFRREHDPQATGYGRLSYLGLVQNAVGGVDGIGGVVALAVAPDGRHVYAVGQASSSIAVFARNPNPGSAGFGQLSYLTRYVNGQGGLLGLSQPVDIRVNATGTQVLVLAAGSGSLARFARTEGDGSLALLASAREGVEGAQGLVGSRRLRLAPDGVHAYVAGGDGIAHFDLTTSAAPGFLGRIRNADPAPLTGGQVLGLAGAADVFIAPEGDRLYAAGSVDDALGEFVRDPIAPPAEGSGVLAYRGSQFDGLGGVAPGDSVPYEIRVSNLGPSGVAQARVVDIFPPEFDEVVWECAGTNGGNCPVAGNGDLDVLVNLPAGAGVQFLAIGRVSKTATGRLVNTATVSAVGAVDSNPSNNSATDDDTVLSPAVDLVVDVDDGSEFATPGGPIEYAARVTNLGPSFARAVSVTDQVPPALHDVSWRCEPFPKAGELELLTPLYSGPLETYTGFATGSVGRFAYATGQFEGQGAVALFRRDPLTGRLFDPVLSGDARQVQVNGENGVRGIGDAADLALSPDRRFVYVAGRSSDSIALFARNADNGSLQFVTSFQDGELGVDGLGGVNRLLIDPSGRHLYASGAAENAIAVFAINPVTGALGLLGVLRQGQGGVDGLNGMTDLAFSADAAQLLVVSNVNQSLAAFSRNDVTGLLSPLALLQDFQLPRRALRDPRAVAVVGSQVLVAGGSDGVLARFTLEPAASPALRYVDSLDASTPGLEALLQPQALLFEPDQDRLYVGGAGRLFLLSLQEDTPAVLADYGPLPTLGSGLRLAISGDGRQLYSAAAGGAPLGVYSRARGSRCPLGGEGGIGRQSVDIATGGSVLFTVRGRVFANAQGLLEYRVEAQARTAGEELNPGDNIDTDIDQLRPAPDLSVLKQTLTPRVVAGLPIDYRIDVANAGVSDALQARVLDPLPLFPDTNAGLVPGVGEWTCAANPPLVQRSRLEVADSASLAGIGASVRSADGARLYAVNPGQNALLVFPLDLAGAPGTPEVLVDGSVLPGGTVGGLAGASRVALSADDRHVYVSAAGANGVLVLGFDAASGGHRFIQRVTSGSNGVAGLLGAADVLVSGDGRRVFVAGASANAIAVFSRDADTGALTFIERVADGLGTIVPDSNVIRGVRRLVLSDDGARLYAAATLSQAISRFDVGSDGRLTYRGRKRADEAGFGRLAGARALQLGPGGEQLYVLGSQGLSVLRPLAGGSFSLQAEFPWTQAAPVLPRALGIDAEGTRVHVLDSSGGIDVYARDWADGALEWRFRLAPVAPVDGTPEASLGTLADDGSLYLTLASGRLQQLGQRALSRCLEAQVAPDRIDTTLDLGVAGDALFELASRVHPSARGVLNNTASIAPGSGIDPDLDNNTSTTADVIEVESDLSVSKQGPDEAVAGLDLTYRIEVGNAGPSDALGMRVTDPLPAALSNARWTCVASAGSSCPASGVGPLDMPANLLVGGQLEIELTARVSPAYVGPLTNTVALVNEPGATDPNPDDNSDSWTTDVLRVADVSVQKSNGVDSVVAGEVYTWDIRVANAGPSDTPQLRVRDPLPLGLQAASWTCSASGAASCEPAGNGGIDQIVSVPAGSELLFQLSGRIDPGLTGSFSNTASVQVQLPGTDPEPANDSATDTDTVLVRHDLGVSLIDPLDPFDPAGSVPFPYLVIIENIGPSDARAVTLQLQFSAPVSQLQGLPCVPAGPAALSCDLETLRAGFNRVLELSMAALPTAPRVFTVSALVAAGGGGEEIDPGNNVASEDTQLVSGADVRVFIDNGVDNLVPGDTTNYTIRVENIGSQATQQVRVLAPAAAGLIDVAWTCVGVAGGSCAPSGSGGIDQVIALQRGQGVRYTLSARLDPDADTAQVSVLQTVQAVPEDVSDINLSNNQAEDEDIIRFIVFRDGFEALLRGAMQSWEPQAAACTRLRLDASTLGLEGAPAAASTLRLLRGEAGPARISVDLLSAQGQRWLRLDAPAAAVGWLPWPSRFAELELATAVLALQTSAGRHEAVLAARSDWRWWLAPALGSISANDCEGAKRASGELR